MEVDGVKGKIFDGNGLVLNSFNFPHSELVKGGLLEIELGLSRINIGEIKYL